MNKQMAGRLAYGSLTLLVIWFLAAVTFALISSTADARPKAAPSNLDALHLRCSDCGTATPVLQSDQALSVGGGAVFEARVQRTPVARINPKGVWGNVPLSISMTSGITTITPSSNIVLVAPSAAVTLSKIVTANWQNGATLLIHNTVATSTVISESSWINLSTNTITLGLGDNLQLIYNQATDTWFRFGGSDN